MNNEEKILLLLERIQEDVGGLKQGQTRIEKDIINIKDDIINIKDDVKEYAE